MENLSLKKSPVKPKEDLESDEEEVWKTEMIQQVFEEKYFFVSFLTIGECKLPSVRHEFLFTEIEELPDKEVESLMPRLMNTASKTCRVKKYRKFFNKLYCRNETVIRFSKDAFWLIILTAHEDVVFLNQLKKEERDFVVFFKNQDSNDKNQNVISRRKIRRMKTKFLKKRALYLKRIKKRMSLNFTKFSLMITNENCQKLKDYFISFFVEFVCKVVNLIFILTYPRDMKTFSSHQWKVQSFKIINSLIYNIDGLIFSDRVLAREDWWERVKFSKKSLLQRHKTPSERDLNSLKVLPGSKSDQVKVEQEKIQSIIEKEKLEKRDLKLRMMFPTDFSPVTNIKNSLDKIDERIRYVDDQQLHFRSRTEYYAPRKKESALIRPKTAPSLGMSRYRAMYDIDKRNKDPSNRIKNRKKKWFEEGNNLQKYVPISRKKYLVDSKRFKPYSKIQSPFVKMYLKNLKKEQLKERIMTRKGRERSGKKYSTNFKDQMLLNSYIFQKRVKKNFPFGKKKKVKKRRTKNFYKTM